MNNWAEFHISIVYFSGLLIALITSVLSLLYLRPVRATINIITGQLATVWNGSFKMTVMLGGLLGAMSVTFTDCGGGYDKLVGSPYHSAIKGIEQVSSSFNYLAIVMGIWLIIFITLRLTSNKRMRESDLRAQAKK
ncbi:MAG: hypothetical protein JKY52_18895 [Flavobacteriales bacterium]|nr:hypothetical protein [Flavobacteriales bacterium]